MSSKVWAFVVAVVVLLAGGSGGAAVRSVLFIGNSFTFAAGSAVRFYRAETVTDLNGQGQGGVPALFRSFANQAGLDFDVSLETQPGSGLEFHLANRRDLIAKRPWDTVVMHGQSTLDFEKPGDPGKLVETSGQMATLLRGVNPRVDIYLLSTWSRADQTYQPTGAWTGKPIEAMARDVRAAYDLAAARITAKAILPVGEAWTRAMQTGVADPNPYDGVEAGKLDLWTWDHYHASIAGSYLEALVVFGGLTGRDPRSLGDLECSAYELGLTRAHAKALQQVAFDQLTSNGTALTGGTGTPAPAMTPRAAGASAPTPPPAPQRCEPRPRAM
ncbi:MAG: PEP-CTERM sorting domain-containing protein [Vicinamibacteraceae bacterium]